MTFDEAIFCMKQYLPDSDSLECMKCPYYHTIPIEGTENGFTCKADEAHKIAIKALKHGDVLQEIRQEIESNMESIIGRYDASTPEHNRPSHKIERNNGRKECIDIIDKHIKQIEGSGTE